jgi:hypothetical protein
MFEERIGGTLDAYGAQDWLSPEAFAVVRDYGRQPAREPESLGLGAAFHDQPGASTSSAHGHPATTPLPASSPEPSLFPLAGPAPSHRAPNSSPRRMIPLVMAIIVITGLMAWGIEAFATGRSDSSARRTGPRSGSGSPSPIRSPSPTSSAASPATSDGPVDSTNVLIKNWATKRCVDVPGFGYGSVDGLVNQFTCIGGSGDNQLWNLEVRGEGPRGGNLYLIRNVKDGYCLDLPDYGAQPSATKVSEYYCNGTTGDNQLWWLDERADGVYWIRNYSSDHLCLDVDGQRPTANDVPLIIFTCSDTDDQWWYFPSR